jgi:hypothetical protein
MLASARRIETAISNSTAGGNHKPAGVMARAAAASVSECATVNAVTTFTSGSARRIGSTRHGRNSRWSVPFENMGEAHPDEVDRRLEPRGFEREALHIAGHNELTAAKAHRRRHLRGQGGHGQFDRQDPASAGRSNSSATSNNS